MLKGVDLFTWVGPVFPLQVDCSCRVGDVNLVHRWHCWTDQVVELCGWKTTYLTSVNYVQRHSWIPFHFSKVLPMPVIPMLFRWIRLYMNHHAVRDNYIWKRRHVMPSFFASIGYMMFSRKRPQIVLSWLH